MKHAVIFRYSIRICLSVLIAMGLLLAGCATVPEKSERLERAHILYEQARSNPDIMSNAPVPMYEASQALQKVEQAKDAAEKEHLAYLFEKKTQIAVAFAEQRIAESKRESLYKEKDKILLEAREHEIAMIKREADRRAFEADKSRKEAEIKALELERSRGEAEVLARQAEKARKEAEAKTIEIEKAKSDAEAKALELERARKEAEAKTLEAELARLKAEEATAKRKELESEIAELKAMQTERGLILTLGDILFEFGKDALLIGAMDSIDRLSMFLNKYQNRNVLIEGHTDNVGSSTYNLGLSQRRANAVQSALILRGVSQSRITAKGFGESRPVASNTTPEGRQHNRRVEIIILEDGM